MTDDSVDPGRVVPIRGLPGQRAPRSGTLRTSETIQGRPGNATKPLGLNNRAGETTVTLVKCVVSVSPVLARLISKSAAKESTGLAPVDALLTAAGIQPGELSSLRSTVSRLSDDADRLRSQANAARDQHTQSNTATQRLQQELHVMADMLGVAEQQAQSLAKRNVELERALHDRDARLADSLGVEGLDADGRSAMVAVRDVLRRGTPGVVDMPAAELGILISSLPHPEIRALNTMVAGGGWRLRLVRWLLGARNVA